MIDVAIVGGGPAGLTAACYLRRFHRSCVVLDAGNSRARWIPESNNCPGFPGGVSGVELLRRLRDQADAVSVPVEHATVDDIARRGDGFELRAGGRRWRARRVILASGVADRLPDAPWVEEAVGCGALRLCAVCDAYEARDARVAIHGPADGLSGHVRFLRGYTPHLAVLPSDRDLDPTVAAKMRALGVQVFPAGGSLEFGGQRCSWWAADGSVATFDSVYPYLGYEGRNALVADWGLEAGEEGELKVDRHQQTVRPGLYAIGDVVSGLNQIAVAVGQAAVAATHAHNALPFVPRK